MGPFEFEAHYEVGIVRLLPTQRQLDPLVEINPDIHHKIF
jgi:hypothetical protein